MNFKDYMIKSKETAIYPGQGENSGLGYCILGVASECGEIGGVLKKIFRDDNAIITEVSLKKLRSETSDVCWYVAQICNEIGIDSKAFDVELGEASKEILTGWRELSPETDLSVLNSIFFYMHRKISDIIKNYSETKSCGNLKCVLDQIGRDTIDLFVYLIIFSDVLGLPIEETLQGNLDKLSARKDAGKLGGSGESIEER